MTSINVSIWLALKSELLFFLVSAKYNKAFSTQGKASRLKSFKPKNIASRTLL